MFLTYGEIRKDLSNDYCTVFIAKKFENIGVERILNPLLPAILEMERELDMFPVRLYPNRISPMLMFLSRIWSLKMEDLRRINISEILKEGKMISLSNELHALRNALFLLQHQIEQYPNPPAFYDDFEQADADLNRISLSDRKVFKLHHRELQILQLNVNMLAKRWKFFLEIDQRSFRELQKSF